MAIRVQREDFDPGAEVERFSSGKTNVGGICLFGLLLAGSLIKRR